MDDFKKILTSPVFAISELIFPIGTYFVGLKFVPKKDEPLIYICVSVVVLIIILIYYVNFNSKKAKRIKELEKELNDSKKLLEKANELKTDSDNKLKKFLRFSKKSIRSIRTSCEMMTLSIGILNTYKNKHNEEEIKNIISRYEKIRVEIDSLEENIDE
ncbi:hypothetical protein [Enterococcus faecium]|uniref:Uncharacterized protein n=1 Tax=Enterococcus faecium TaxID=1352 RepID=A0A242BLE1_ENTFC|nr:hypothetical protein [Enterococcus faecium]OTN96261.1 hypothetical protein A5810_000596 [Enterococcus faecium]